MKFKRLLSLGLALSLCLSLAACGGGDDKDPAGSKNPDASGPKIFIDWNDTAHEMEDFNILHSEGAVDGRVLGNVWEGLLTTDAHAKIIPQIATEWSHNDDSSEWYFTLRNDVKWVGHDKEVKADLVAQDFLTGIEWTLNYHKNDAKHLQMLAATIIGAQDYFDYTKELDETAGKATRATDEKFTSTVGVEAPDDTHLVFKLLGPTPYFDSVIMGSCGYPLSQAMVDELGVDGVTAMNNTTMWINGPYILDEVIMGNSKVFVKNPHYWNPDIVSFDEVQVKMVADTETDDQLFMTGEIDRCTVSESNLRLIYNDASHEFHDNLVEVRDSPFAYQIHFNFNKLDADGNPDDNWNKAVNNEAFRKAIRYGVNLEAYWSRFNFINPESGILETFTGAETAVFSDGRDYTDRVKELIGVKDGTPRYDAAKGAQYAAQAKTELAAAGVTFPIECRYYIKAGDQTAADNATVLKEAFEDCFGKDMLNFVIDTYVTSFSQEAQAKHLHSIQTSGWGADYRDPENFLLQIITGADSAYYAARMDFENDALPEVKAQWDEFTNMVLEANKITGNLDERYEAQAQAEAYALDHALIVPLRCPFTAWAMTSENCFTHPRNSYKYVNYELKGEPYTSAEYEQLWADFNAGK